MFVYECHSLHNILAPTILGILCHTHLKSSASPMRSNRLSETALIPYVAPLQTTVGCCQAQYKTWQAKFRKRWINLEEMYGSHVVAEIEEAVAECKSMVSYRSEHKPHHWYLLDFTTRKQTNMTSEDHSEREVRYWKATLAASSAE